MENCHIKKGSYAYVIMCQYDNLNCGKPTHCGLPTSNSKYDGKI